MSLRTDLARDGRKSMFAFVLFFRDGAGGEDIRPF